MSRQIRKNGANSSRNKGDRIESAKGEETRSILLIFFNLYLGYERREIDNESNSDFSLFTRIVA